MANFYVHVQPSGNTDEYLVNLFFTDMQSAFSSAHYYEIGLCTEPFSDGDSSISGRIWYQAAMPYSNQNWYYRCVTAPDDGIFYPNNSYTLYAYAKDADNGQYWNFNAGTATTIYIRSVHPGVRMGTFYAAVSFDDLCVPWNHMNYNLIGLSPVDFEDGSAFEFEPGYWEAHPQSVSGSGYGTNIYLEEGLTVNEEYEFIPYARLPNGELYHILAPGEKVTFTYIPAPDGPVPVTGKPENLNAYDAGTNYVAVDCYYDRQALHWLWIKTTCFETGEVVYEQDYSLDIWDFDDGGYNATVYVRGLQPSSTYMIEMRYMEYYNYIPIIGTQKSVTYAVTKPQITYASAEIFVEDNTHKILIRTVGSAFGAEDP